MKKIAIQGFKGSFHDIAAHRYFCEDDDIQPICCDTFEQVFENIKRDPTVIGMVAIENTIAGSLLHNYELLHNHNRRTQITHTTLYLLPSQRLLEHS